MKIRILVIFAAVSILSIGAASAGEYWSRYHLTCPGAGCRHSYHRHYEPFERGAGRCPYGFDDVGGVCFEQRAYHY